GPGDSGRSAGGGRYDRRLHLDPPAWRGGGGRRVAARPCPSARLCHRPADRGRDAPALRRDRQGRVRQPARPVRRCADQRRSARLGPALCQRGPGAFGDPAQADRVPHRRRPGRGWRGGRSRRPD
ncbi:hypothetical protein LTR94_035009, partial [Friedmanniomyces endolithicus]